MSYDNPSKKFLALFTLQLVVILALAAIANFYANTYWAFPNHLPADHQYLVKDERLTKTVRLAYGEEAFDGVMIGSSRTTLIDAAGLDGNTFNYAASNMRPGEFGAYVDFFTAQNGPPDRIYYGIDFFAANLANKTAADPGKYIADISQPLHRAQLLLSLDGLIDAISGKFGGERLRERGEMIYTFDGRKLGPRERSNAATLRIIDGQRRRAEASQYGANKYGESAFRWDPSLEPGLMDLRERYAGAKTTVFIPPVSAPFFEIMTSKERLPDYARWLRLNVEVFGDVIDLGGYNSFTCDVSHYYDAHHVYPRFGVTLAQRIGELANNVDPSRFGKRLTAASLPAYLAELEETAGIGWRDACRRIAGADTPAD